MNAKLAPTISWTTLLGVFFFIFFARYFFVIILDNPQSLAIYSLHAYAGLCGAILIVKKHIRISIKNFSFLLTIYLLFLILSSFVTYAANPFYGLKALTYSSISLLVFILASQINIKTGARDFETLFKLLQVGITLVLLIWLAKGEASENALLMRYSTTTLSFNVAGFFSILLIIISTVFIKRKTSPTLPNILLIAVGVAILYLGLNKSSILILFLFLLTYTTSLRLNIRSAFLFFLMLLFMATFLYIVFPAIADLLTTEEGLRVLSTGTGRTAIWHGLVSSISSIPQLVFGSGFGSAELFFDSNEFLSYDFGHAHNALLQSIYEVGLVGSLLLHYIVLSNIYNGIRLTKRANSAAGDIFLWINIAILIRGITEAGYAQLGSFDSYFILASFVFYQKTSRSSIFHPPQNSTTRCVGFCLTNEHPDQLKLIQRSPTSF